MSKITKIKIKNLFGISEYNGDGKSVELSGQNGVGKSSVIDAIRYALTNKSDRRYRKARTNQADYKSVKQNGHEVGSPETFLKDIFTPLQLSPVEFMDKTEKEQNAIILDMIQYDWSLQTIRDWFGEIPDWVSYDQNILQILNDIQSEKGDYYRNRQDVNRDIRNKKSFIEDIASEIPEGYDAKKWENENLGELYQKIERARKENENIEKAKRFVEQRDNKVRSFEADKEIKLSALERLEAQLRENEIRMSGLAEKKEDKTAVIKKEYEANVAKYDSAMEEYKDIAEKDLIDFSELQEQAQQTEKMKSYLNEYKRMLDLQDEVAELTEESEEYTRKIEKARMLPGEILETATIPINGLTVKDGIPLINGLPISNLSDGEKLDLCIDVAIQKPNGLQIVLIDGVEKMSTKMREGLYKKCKDKGLQFIATRTTDEEDLTVIEL